MNRGQESVDSGQCTVVMAALQKAGVCLKRKINFLSSYKGKNSSAFVITQILFAGVTLLIIVSSVVASLLYRNETNHINSQINNILLNEAIREPSEMYSYSALARIYKELLNEYAADQASASEFISIERSKILEAINIGAPNIVITGDDFSIEKGLLTLLCTAKNQSMPKDYVKKLRDTGLYDNVSYTGYTTDGGTVMEASFSVSILLGNKK